MVILCRIFGREEERDGYTVSECFTRKDSHIVRLIYDLFGFWVRITCTVGANVKLNDCYKNDLHDEKCRRMMADQGNRARPSLMYVDR